MNAKPQTVVTTGVTEDKYEYVWKIDNFLMIQKSGAQLESQKFEIATGKDSQLQSRWVVGLKNNYSGSQYFVYCRLLDVKSRNGRVGELASRFTVQLRDGSNAVRWTAEVKGNVKVGEGFELEGGHRWDGTTNWSGFLDSNGTATLDIKLTLLTPFSGDSHGSFSEEAVEQQFKEQSVSLAKQNLARFLLSDSSTDFDVKIVCSDGEEFKCHQLILKANSSVFSSMLASGLSEAKTGVVNVTDISGKAMEVLLQYLYTGDLLPTWYEPDVIVELTYAAGKYQLKDLLDYLDNKLGSLNYGGDKYSPGILLALLDMTNKLSLKKAEAGLEDRVVTRVISAKSGGGILSVFQNVD